MSKFSVVPSKETCAVWSVTPEYITGGILEVETGKTVRAGKLWRRPRGEKVGKEFVERLRNIPLVLSLNSRVAYTAILPFRLVLQDDAQKDRLEFHGILRELVNKANLETRLLAARALGVEDLDSVLFDARVMNLKIDGKEAAGWPQTGGKKIEGQVHATFTTRAVFHELQEVLRSRKEIYATEESKAALMVLSREIKGPLRILEADPDRAEFLILDYRHEPVLRKIPVKFDSPLSLLMAEWGIGEEQARRILRLAEEKEISAAADKFLSRLSENSLESFRKILQKTKFRKTIYFRGRDVLPFTLPHAEEEAEFKAYPLTEVWNSLGFEGEPAPELAPMILPFLEFHYYRGDPAYHRALNRQIHWITP